MLNRLLSRAFGVVTCVTLACPSVARAELSYPDRVSTCVKYRMLNEDLQSIATRCMPMLEKWSKTADFQMELDYLILNDPFMASFFASLGASLAKKMEK